MKKLTQMVSVLFLGGVIAMAGCKKDDDSGSSSGSGKSSGNAKGSDKGSGGGTAKASGGGTASASGGGGGGGGTGLADCDAYVAAVDKYMQCDKVPQQARDAAKQGIDAMKSGWANTGGMPDDAKKAANDACKQATDALKQGASAMGCSL